MKLFQLLATLSALGATAASLSACKKEPSFSTTPSISFKSLRRVRNNPADPKAQPTDTIFVTVNYQDGDGDLGLNSDEQGSPPFVGTRFANNYFIKPLVVHKDGTLEGIDLAGNGVDFEDNGTFFHISDAAGDKSLPLRGTLTRQLYYNLGDILPVNQPLCFQVSIADRALHESNVILTDTFRIPPRGK